MNIEKIKELASKLQILDINGTKGIGIYDEKKNEVGYFYAFDRKYPENNLYKWVEKVNTGETVSMKLSAGTSVTIRDLNDDEAQWISNGLVAIERAKARALAEVESNFYKKLVYKN